jgi:hypothetical protein
MSKGLNLKAFEEKADKEGLTWEMKEQFERALHHHCQPNLPERQKLTLSW